MSSESTIKVLLIEDNPGDARLVQEELSGSMDTFFNTVHKSTLQDAIQAMVESKFDVILSDLSLPDSKGIETFQSIITAQKGVPIVILSGTKDESLAMQAVREGAHEYLNKEEINDVVLIRTLKYAIERQKHFEDFFKRRETLRTITENVSDLIIVIDKDGNYKYKSPSFIKTIGETNVHTNCSIIDDVEDKESIKTHLHATLQSTSAMNYEFNILHKDGAKIPVKSTTKSIPNTKGEAVEAVFICQLI